MDHPLHGEIYGAFACVIIKFEGTLKELIAKLSKALNLGPESFYIETREDPPHEEFGMAEAMGWEAWLYAVSDSSPGTFRFKMETENALSEIHEGKMFDLSPWLSRLVTTLCEVEAFPENSGSPQ